MIGCGSKDTKHTKKIELHAQILSITLSLILNKVGGGHGMRAKWSFKKERDSHFNNEYKNHMTLQAHASCIIALHHWHILMWDCKLCNSTIVVGLHVSFNDASGLPRTHMPIMWALKKKRGK